MRQDRDNSIYLKHILEAITKISTYTASHTFSHFQENQWDQDALARNLEIIGEAANNLDALFRASMPDVPWRQIVDFRNVIVHDYADLDLQIIWEIATVDLKELQKQLQSSDKTS